MKKCGNTKVWSTRKQDRVYGAIQDVKDVLLDFQENVWTGFETGLEMIQFMARKLPRTHYHQVALAVVCVTTGLGVDFWDETVLKIYLPATRDCMSLWDTVEYHLKHGMRLINTRIYCGDSDVPSRELRVHRLFTKEGKRILFGEERGSNQAKREIREISRLLEKMPVDKVFELINGNQEILHATGREVYIGGGDDYDDPASWYNEYGPDSEGEMRYGR